MTICQLPITRAIAMTSCHILRNHNVIISVHNLLENYYVPGMLALQSIKKLQLAAIERADIVSDIQVCSILCIDDGQSNNRRCAGGRSGVHNTLRCAHVDKK